MRLPAPGWYADPFFPGALRWWDGRTWTPYSAMPGAVAAGGARTTSSAPALDQVLARMNEQSSVPWGARPVVVPLGTGIGLIIVTGLLSAYALPSGATARLIFALVATFLLDGVLVAAVWLGGRDIAARHGGWSAAFGWRRPRRSDFGYAVVGAVVVLLGRGVVALVANAASHGRASAEAQNLRIDHISALGTVVLVLVVVVWAPLVEELMFRGLLLRTFMRKLRFWPAAALATTIFALLHTYEVDTLAGALTLAGGVGVLGLTNCVLARLTASLVPGIIVHAAFNALAVVVIVAQAN